MGTYQVIEARSHLIELPIFQMRKLRLRSAWPKVTSLVRAERGSEVMDAVPNSSEQQGEHVSPLCPLILSISMLLGRLWRVCALETKLKENPSSATF